MTSRRPILHLSLNSRGLQYRPPSPALLNALAHRNRKITCFGQRWWIMNSSHGGWTLSYGSQMKQNIFENKRQAECWKHFHQVASIQDGSPKVMCKICDQILNHPANGHRGTSSMNKHFSQGVNCRRVAPRSQDIRRLMQEGVCQYIYSS